jgi:molybdopterin synthase catalytic subunit
MTDHHHQHGPDPHVEGIDYVQVAEEKLSTEGLTSMVASTKAGAISTFLGVTRDHHAGKKVRNAFYKNLNDCHSSYSNI